jgi:hypothetical protein
MIPSIIRRNRLASSNVLGWFISIYIYLHVFANPNPPFYRLKSNGENHLPLGGFGCSTGVVIFGFASVGKLFLRGLNEGKSRRSDTDVFFFRCFGDVFVRGLFGISVVKLGKDFLLSVIVRGLFGLDGGKLGRADTDVFFFLFVGVGGDFFRGLSGGILGRADKDGLRVGIWGGLEEHISGDICVCVWVVVGLLLFFWLLSLCFRPGDFIDESLDLRGCFMMFFLEKEEGLGGGDFLIFISVSFIISSVLLLSSPSLSLLSPSDKKERFDSWRWDIPRAQWLAGATAGDGRGDDQPAAFSCVYAFDSGSSK